MIPARKITAPVPDDNLVRFAEETGETARILADCNNCGACVKACNFLHHYCDSPRELAKRFNRNPLEIIEIPYSCTLCGLCRRICRKKLYPGGMCHETRVKIFQPLHGQELPNDFVYDFITPRLEGIRNHQIFSTSKVFALSRPPEARGQAPKSVFFPGCSLPAYAPDVVYKSYRYLREKIPGIGMALNCCGKPCKDMGDMDRFRKTFTKTLDEFARMGVEEVVLACINCHKTFRENSDIKLRSIYEIMVEQGLPEPTFIGKGQITIHDSCPARDQPEIRQAVRTIATRLGHEIHDLRFKNELTQCCGAGGCAPTGNTTLADRHTRERAAEAKGTVITYCAHCRERFSTQVPALHILNLVFGPAGKHQPTTALAEHHDPWRNWLHRWQLKRRLQKL